MAAPPKPPTPWRTPIRRLLAMALASALAACAAPEPTTAKPAAAESAPTATACPAALPADARCLGGRDSQGADYLIALPRDWDHGVLVLHDHGGPSLGAPTPARVADDLARWAVMVKAGYAWAGSSFHQGGVAVRAAAQDTERLRHIFDAAVGTPRRTILHGQSWGASVAAKGAEMFSPASGARPPYDALLLTSGVLGGGTHSYDFRLDLRVVYQYLCHNLPRPDEPQYPLNIGLPVGTKLTDLDARVNACLGLNLPAGARTPEQQRKLRTIENVIHIPASSIVAHLRWGTFFFRDIVSKRTGGASPFGNEGAHYAGSDDDAALNAGVLRYRADPGAVARFAADADLTGRIPVPVITVKWIGDPTAFVELDHRFQQTMEHAGAAQHLVQTFTRQGTHSYINDVTYAALMTELLGWVEHGAKPTPASVAARCQALQARWGADCSFEPDYAPPALDTRVPRRERP